MDLSAFPPLPPRAHELGLDGIERVEARWGIQDKGIVVTLGVNAPRPRRGILTLFDQPPIKAGTSVVAAGADEGYTLMSIDPIKTADAILALVRHDNPEAAARIDHLAERFGERSGLSLRNDLLAKVGPRMALLLPAGGGGGSVISFWFRPPDFVLLAELKDTRDFAAKLDRLIEFANRELKTAGAMVRPSARPAQPAGDGVRRVPPAQGPRAGLRPRRAPRGPAHAGRSATDGDRRTRPRPACPGGLAGGSSPRLHRAGAERSPGRAGLGARRFGFFSDRPA